MKATSIFFDLDGTLIDSKLDLANSLNAAFEAFSLPTLDNERIYSFVGNGVRRLIEDSLRFVNALDKFDDVFYYFLSHYDEHLLVNTKLYDGVEELLEKLKSKDKKLFVITNKSFRFAYKILKGLGVDKLFDEIVGGDTFSAKKPDPMPIIELSKKHNVKLSSAIVVGDSENDIEAAKRANVSVGWAAYGFRDREILKLYNVDFVIEKPKELLNVIE
ncbi:HAD family hydrolase [Hippea alviniae]|uniref:HAD family hydrolase n=1 Tax=Hippea alviniae TaxID=1279027 RepID=UPI0003B4264A|nr:HAD-IA family hydrolase [Hippea alviniae]